MAVARRGIALVVAVLSAAALLMLLRPGAGPRDEAADGPVAEAPPLSLDEDADVQALEALGYLDEARDVPPDARVGVLEHDPQRTRDGLDYVTVARSCLAYVARPDGRVLRRWSHAPCARWDNSLLTPRGEVLVPHARPMPPDASLVEIVEESTSLLKLGWDGALLWERKLPVHHDVGLTPDGNIAVLVRRLRVLPDLHPTIPVRDHGIAVLSPEGEVLEEAFLTDIVARSRRSYRPLPARMLGGADKRSINPFHANSIDWMTSEALARSDDFYSLDNVLLTLRAQDAIVLVHWPSRTITWSWGPGELSGPHDAHVLPSGNILVFDNGTVRRRSRVVELDPRSGEIVWQYAGHAFFSPSRGGAQRLPGGNTLVAVSDSAEAFEVTPGGERVWRFLNPLKGPRGGPAAIVRIRSYRPGPDGKPLAPVD